MLLFTTWCKQQQVLYLFFFFTIFCVNNNNCSRDLFNVHNTIILLKHRASSYKTDWILTKSNGEHYRFTFTNVFWSKLDDLDSKDMFFLQNVPVKFSRSFAPWRIEHFGCAAPSKARPNIQTILNSKHNGIKISFKLIKFRLYSHTHFVSFKFKYRKLLNKTLYICPSFTDPIRSLMSAKAKIC